MNDYSDAMKMAKPKMEKVELMQARLNADIQKLQEKRDEL